MNILFRKVSTHIMAKNRGLGGYMPANLRMADSFEKCCSSIRSHIRRCGHKKGAEFLVTNIKDPFEKFKTKKVQVDALEEELENAYDNADYQDGEIDNTVRDCSGRAKEIDRKIPGSNLFSKLFPYGIKEVISLNREKKPDAVDQIAILIENLGSGHELFPFASLLRTEAQKSRDTNNAYNESVKKLNSIKTEFDIVKSDLLTQYTNNILDSKKNFGNEYTDRLFPKNRAPGSGKNDPQNNDNGKINDKLTLTTA